MNTTLENPGWKLRTEERTDVLKCPGRISGYQPIYIAGGEFANKLTRHVHEDIKHLGVANIMPTVREGYWIPHLRAPVKKVINDCKVCKVFSAQRYGPAATAPLPLNFVWSLEIKGTAMVRTAPMAQEPDLRKYYSTRRTGSPIEVAAVITRRGLRCRLLTISVILFLLLSCGIDVRTGCLVHSFHCELTFQEESLSLKSNRFNFSEILAEV